MSGFQVDSDRLRQHAGNVSGVVGQISTARSAATQTDIHGGAFGVLCAFLPAIISGTASAAQGALDTVHTAADKSVDELIDMARTFDVVDERVEMLLKARQQGLR